MDIAVVDFMSANAPEKFAESLHETGFAVLVNHRIPSDLLRCVYREWSDFFNSDAKYRYLYSRVRQDGYFPRPEEQSSGPGQPPRDDKEFFHIFPWGRYPSEVSDAAAEYRVLATKVAGTLLGWAERNAPPYTAAKVGAPLSSTLIGGEKNTLLRILRYPAVRAGSSHSQPRAGVHSDTNLITLLASASQPGLQIRMPQGHWQDVPWDFGSITVNAGVLLELMTGSYFPAVAHRVVVPAGGGDVGARLSMPLFLHPADDVLVEGSTTAAEFLQRRLDKSYSDEGRGE